RFSQSGTSITPDLFDPPFYTFGSVGTSGAGAAITVEAFTDDTFNEFVIDSNTIIFDTVDAANDNDGNGLPDAPFLQLAQAGDQWYASSGTKQVAMARWNGGGRIPPLAVAVEGSGFLMTASLPANVANSGTIILVVQ